MITTAIDGNVILFCLPPHTTHRLQPNDVGAYSPLKRAWNKASNQFLVENGVPLRAKDVVAVYLNARLEAFKPETIKQAWRKAGIGVNAEGQPQCDMTIFTAADFAPSISSSTQLHLPEGFPLPHHIPLSFTRLPDDDPSSDSDDPDPSDVLFPLPRDISDSDDSDYDPGYDPDPDSSSVDSGSDSDDSDYNPDMNGYSSEGDSELSDDTDSVYEELTSDEESVEDPDDEDTDDPSWKRKAQKYKTRYLASKAWCFQLAEELQVALAHCEMAAMHITELQAKLNAKRKAKKKKDKQQQGNDRSVHIGSRIVTSQEGKKEAEKQDAARLQKSVAETQKAQRREDASVAVREARSVGQGNMVFEGSLASQKVGGLRDIAWNLKINEQGSKVILLERIKTHFSEHEHLRNDKQYSALFPAARKRTRPTLDPAILPTSPSRSTTPSFPSPTRRRRLEDVTNTFQSSSSQLEASSSSSSFPFMPPVTVSGDLVYSMLPHFPNVPQSLEPAFSVDDVNVFRTTIYPGPAPTYYR